MTPQKAPKYEQSAAALVLLVEDSTRDIAMINGWLDQFGIQSWTASKVLNAEKMLRSRLVNFDAILLDMNMPDAASGDETFNRVKEAVGDQDIEIIILTGGPISPEFMKMMIRVGAFRVLSKLDPPDKIDSAKYDVKEAVEAAVMKKRARMRQTRNDTPSKNYAVATQDWVGMQLAEFELKISPLLEFVGEQKEAHERALERAAQEAQQPRRHIALRPGDWRSEVKIAMLVLGWMGYDTFKHQPEPAQPVAAAPAPEQPHWRRELRNDNSQRGASNASQDSADPQP